MSEFHAFLAKNRHLSPPELFDKAAADDGQTVRWPDLEIKHQCNFLDLMANAPSSLLLN